VRSGAIKRLRPTSRDRRAPRDFQFLESAVACGRADLRSLPRILASDVTQAGFPAVVIFGWAYERGPPASPGLDRGGELTGLAWALLAGEEACSSLMHMVMAIGIARAIRAVG
jgi:hypothetical protein